MGPSRSLTNPQVKDKAMTLQTNFYFLSPVEVVRVTPKNLEEVAEWCGGKVAETESRRQEGRMDKYVWVPTPKGSAISWAFPGMFITKRVVVTEHDEVKITYSVFRKAYFKANYFQTPDAAVDATWERQAREAGKKVHPANGVTPKDLKNQLKSQLPSIHDGGQINIKDPEPTNVTINITEAGSDMVAQRQLIHESLVEQGANRDPHRL